jgi:hypothetical protein
MCMHTCRTAKMKNKIVLRDVIAYNVHTHTHTRTHAHTHIHTHACVAAGMEGNRDPHVEAVLACVHGVFKVLWV